MNIWEDDVLGYGWRFGIYGMIGVIFFRNYGVVSRMQVTRRTV